MGTEFIDRLREAQVQEETNAFLKRIGGVVDYATAPFNVGNVTVLLDEDVLFNRRRVRVEVERLEDYQYVQEFNNRVIYSVDDPQSVVFRLLSQPLFNHFRYRPCLPVEDHIILGEE